MTNKEKKTNYKKTVQDISKNYWAISTVALATLLIATLFFLPGNTCGAVISAEEAGQNVLDFASKQGVEAEIISNEENGSFYIMVLSVDGQEVPVYVTKDGENMAQLIPLKTQAAPEPTPTELTKSDNPNVELFIMTHCPYGTQAEKGFIPLMESFDKASLKIRFVHYFMHDPEETETPIQICIREEQSDKFLPYLRKFLEEGISEDAITAAGIDETAMEECISSGKWEEYYDQDKALSEAYGVQGSPTLVVNGAIAQSGRDAASYLATTCAAFNTAPEECSTLTLTSTSPTPMWGWDASATPATDAQC